MSTEAYKSSASFTNTNFMTRSNQDQYQDSGAINKIKTKTLTLVPAAVFW